MTAALALAACAVPQQGGTKRAGGASLFGNIGQAPTQYFVDEVVDVATEPAGAAVNVNDVFAGNSPVRVTVRRYWRGQPGSMTLDPVKVEALGSGPGQCTQSGLFGQGSQKAPSPVRLYMTNCAGRKK